MGQLARARLILCDTFWVQERRNIEEQIKMARVQRLKEELEALEWERRRAAGELILRSALFWLGVGVLGVLASIVYWSGWVAPYLFDSFSWVVYLDRLPAFALVAPVIAAMLGYLIQTYGVTSSVRALWAKIRSIEELDDLAARYTRRARVRRRDLFSGNPQLRYAVIHALLSVDFDPETLYRGSGILTRILSVCGLAAPIRSRQIQRAIDMEVNPTVRRVMSWYLKTEKIFMNKPTQAWPERVYYLEGIGLPGIFESELSQAQWQLIEAALGTGEIATAYTRGITEEIWRAASFRHSAGQVQSMIRRLSPLERPGLGTFDYLTDISEIDHLYLFFRQWMYYLELDLPTQDRSATA